MSVRENIKSGKYKSKLAYPTRPSKPSKPSNDATSQDYIDYAELLRVWEAEIEIYKNDLKAYQKSESEGFVQFKIDAFDECGITDHPHKDKIYYRAYEQGHSHGLSSVFEELEEICSFLSEIEVI